MAKYKIGALIVMDGPKMVGVISERDYAREIILEGKSSKDTKVEEIMTKKVLTLSADDKFEKGLEIMTQKRIRHLPVMDGNELLGMVSQGDLVKEMIDYQKELIKELEAFVYW
jgi:CBS domain-containing protein